LWLSYKITTVYDGKDRLRMIRDLRPVLRRLVGVHHQPARVGLAIDAGAEACRLRLQAGAQAGLPGVDGDTGEAAGGRRLAPFQSPGGLRQAVFVAVALGRDTLLSADTLGMALRRSRRHGRQEGDERADDQRAAECEGGMHPAVGHGYDSKGPLPDKRPAEPRGCPFQARPALLQPQFPSEKRLSPTSRSTRHDITSATTQPTSH